MEKNILIKLANLLTPRLGGHTSIHNIHLAGNQSYENRINLPNVLWHGSTIKIGEK